MDLPVYQLQIDESLDGELEVDAVALVDKPAIEKNFLYFKEAKRLTFNEEKGIIAGPAMIADMPIYRKNDEYGEHYVVFTKDQIKLIANKFLAKGYAQRFNLFHDPSQATDGVSVLSSFVSDKELGIAPMVGFEDTPDGSWFIAAKVNNDEVKAKIKSGEIRGYSVEGMFKYAPAQSKEQQIMHSLKNFLSILKQLD
jgi:hypothetical protein